VFGLLRLLGFDDRPQPAELPDTSTSTATTRFNYLNSEVAGASLPLV